MTLAIHTVFILRENILFLEEWIAYHLSIGFDKIYLYDNSNSRGLEGRENNPMGINKYGYNFEQITQHISNSELEKRLSDLLEKYKKEITYIKWEPTDLNGEIFYYQNESIIDYIKNYSHEVNWTAFIDIDEFIFSKSKLKEVLNECDNAGIGDIVLFQKKFDDRFNNPDKPVTHIVACVEGIDTTEWGPKHLFKNDCFDLNSPKVWNIHSLPFKNCYKLLADIKTLPFNHYNINAFQLKWMQSFYNTTDKFKLNSTCYELYNQYYT